MIINLAAPAIRRDPYPTYAHLRAMHPVTRARIPIYGESWLVTRYDDVARGLRHPALSSDARRAGGRAARDELDRWMPKVFKVLQRSMVTVDDPDHRRLRNLVHQAFTPRRVERLTADIDAIVDRLLDDLARAKRADLLAAYALPLPLTIIGNMLGVPNAERSKFRRWSAEFLEAGAGDPTVFLRQIPNALRLARFFRELIARRRAEPSDDLVTALVQAEEARDRLSEDELVGAIFLLLPAGHETTVNLIGTGVLGLLQFPEQFARLRERPELIDTAIEEILRWGNPVEHGTARYALNDLELAGWTIPKGSVVTLLLASANRDEERFADPDTLDIARDPNRHLAFGLGIHYCLGAPLARLEGRIAIQKLVQRFPDLRLATATSQLRWRDTIAVRGLRALPVAVA